MKHQVHRPLPKPLKDGIKLTNQFRIVLHMAPSENPRSAHMAAHINSTPFCCYLYAGICASAMRQVFFFLKLWRKIK